jgi:hypothetical protein
VPNGQRDGSLRQYSRFYRPEPQCVFREVIFGLSAAVLEGNGCTFVGWVPMRDLVACPVDCVKVAVNVGLALHFCPVWPLADRLCGLMELLATDPEVFEGLKVRELLTNSGNERSGALSLSLALSARCSNGGNQCRDLANLARLQDLMVF